MSFLSLDDLQASLRFRHPIAKQPYAGNVFPTPLWNRKDVSWICGNYLFSQIFVVQDVVLCFPGRWHWNRKLRRSQSWPSRDMFPHMFRLEDPCSMTCDIGLWKMRLSNAFKFAFALWVLPGHDNHLLIFVSQMNQVQERKSRRIYRIYTIMTLWYIMTDPLV